MFDHQYPITYQIEAHENGPTEDEVREQGLGGCDSFLFMSFIGEPGAGGSLSTAVFAGAGIGHKDGGPIRDFEPSQKFVAWLMLTKHVMDDLPDGDTRKDLLEMVFDVATSGVRHEGCDDPDCVCSSGGESTVVS